MVQVIEQTREQKIAMYMKLSKREISEMLVNCNDVLMAQLQRDNCQHEYPNPWFSILPPHCMKCGKQAQAPGFDITFTTTGT